MMEKVLNLLIKMLAVVIIGVFCIMGSLLYKNKYMLVQGAEQTLDRSIYSSKDLEIAISSISLTKNELKITVKNKSDKKLNVKLEEFKINGLEYKTDINLDVDEHSIEEQTAIIAKTSLKEVENPNILDCTFIVNDKHDIEVSISLGSNKDD